jgi:hypothetical protein
MPSGCLLLVANEGLGVRGTYLSSLPAGSHGSPCAFELDHITPISQDERLALSPMNFAPSHAVCNRRRSNGEVVSEPGSERGGLGEASEDWDALP